MSHLLPGVAIRVLVVEDSPSIAQFLCELLAADPAIRVVGVVGDGEAAVDAARRLRPSVITMDIHLPRVNGIDATRRIMETCPTPVVIVSGSVDASGQGGESVHAVAAGALATVPRPAGVGHPDHAASARQLVEMVKLMSEVRVVRRWPRRTDAAAAAGVARPARDVRAIAIGASTGGPLVLQSILAALPAQLPVPLLIVQHMAPGFVDSFAEWLGQTTGFPVRIPRDGDALLPGHAYVAPDDRHMGVRHNGGRIALCADAPENGLRPAVSYLFRSLQATLAPHVVAVLLTGMGRDGVEELVRLRQAGALTIAQDEQSSVVFGMPGQAVEAGAVSHVLSPDGIASLLAGLSAPA